MSLEKVVLSRRKKMPKEGLLCVLLFFIYLLFRVPLFQLCHIFTVVSKVCHRPSHSHSSSHTALSLQATLRSLSHTLAYLNFSIHKLGEEVPPSPSGSLMANFVWMELCMYILLPVLFLMSFWFCSRFGVPSRTKPRWVAATAPPGSRLRSSSCPVF